MKIISLFLNQILQINNVDNTNNRCSILDNMIIWTGVCIPLFSLHPSLVPSSLQWLLLPSLASEALQAYPCAGDNVGAHVSREATGQETDVVSAYDDASRKKPNGTGREQADATAGETQKVGLGTGGIAEALYRPLMPGKNALSKRFKASPPWKAMTIDSVHIISLQT